MTRRPRNGFTLLELLVVLAVFGLLLVMLSQGVEFGLRSWAAQSGSIARRSELEGVDRALRRLIEHMDPGDYASLPLVDGGPHNFAFATELPASATWLRTREANVALGVDAAHRLVVHWTPRLPGIAVGALPPQTIELLRGVERLDLHYWREGGPGGGAWLDAWHADSLPALVRLRVIFADGDRRHWPDLIAAPRRARPVTWNRRDAPQGAPA